MSIVNPIWPGKEGTAAKFPALISTIESFPDIHGKATKSGDFSSNLLENTVMEKMLSMVSLVAMATKFSMPYLVNCCFKF